MDSVIFKKAINGLNVLVRYPKTGDAGAMCDYINKLSKEQTYITRQGETIKLEEEEKYLAEQLEKIKNKETVQLLMFVGQSLAGITSIDLGKRVQSHIGVLGISIAKEFRGKGLGKLLMKLVLEEASKNLKNLKTVTLGVFSENERAMKMYENFGFAEYGRLPKGIKYKGRFVDDVLMFKEV